MQHQGLGDKRSKQVKTGKEQRTFICLNKFKFLELDVLDHRVLKNAPEVISKRLAVIVEKSGVHQKQHKTGEKLTLQSFKKGKERTQEITDQSA